MKRTLIIAGVLFAILAFGGLGFYLRSRSKASVTSTPSSPAVNPGLPSSGASVTPSPSTGASPDGTAKLSTIISAPLLAYFVRADGGILTVEKGGKVALTTNVSSTLLSTRSIPDVVAAWFAPDGKKILFKASGDTVSPYWSVYDVEANSFRQLSIDARDVVFAPQGESVAYFARRTSGVTLTTLDLSRTAAKPSTLLSLAAEDLSLVWMSPSTLLFGERPSGAVNGSLWSLDMRTRSVKQVLADQPGMQTLWGKDGGLLFVSGQGGGSLSLVGNDLRVQQAFAFITLPSKCAFYAAASSSSALLCGIPRDAATFRRAFLPDDYETGALATDDDIMSIDLRNGIITPILSDPSAHVDVQNATVAGSTVYFMNRWDGRLYKQNLP